MRVHFVCLNWDKVTELKISFVIPKNPMTIKIQRKVHISSNM